MVTEPVTNGKAFGVPVSLRERERERERERDKPPGAVPGEPGFVRRSRVVEWPVEERFRPGSNVKLFS
jgi:hypothetical protein